MPVSGVPGVHDKVQVSERMSLPVRESALATHLLKFGQQGLRRLISNEHACLKALADARLQVNQAQVVADVTGEQALLVTRFDRQVINGTVGALRQLAGLCSNPTVAALRLLEQVAASFLIGNGDLHTKNLSVLDRGDGQEPSPVYDVTFTHPYGDTDTMALPVCGESRVAKTGRATFTEAAMSCGLRAAAMERVIDRLLARTKDVPEQLSAEWPRASSKYRRVLEQRRHQLSR